MEEKKVIVFGASGGIGKTVVSSLKSEYSVIAVDKSDAVMELEDEKTTVLQLDMEDEAAVDKLQALLDQTSNLYGAVFATGIMIPGSVTELSQEDWDKTVQINLTLIFQYTKLVLPYLMKNKRSHIIMFASHLGVVGSYNLTAYSVTKAALIEFVKCLALDYGDAGVIANSISPGFVKTPMLSKARKSFSTNKKWMFACGGLPKQYMNPLDIANLVMYLLNQESMNGENIVIDGGERAR